jgi:excisionase family DNA binding protein
MPHVSENLTVPAVAYTIRTAVAASGISRSRIYELISHGKLEARKDGRKTLVVASSLDAYLRALPALKPKTYP